MRRILVESARRKLRPKHRGDRERVDLENALLLSEDRADQLIALEQALEQLARESPEKAKLVNLRYFAGLTHQEAAQALGISRATADRYWAYAKVFLHCIAPPPTKIASSRTRYNWRHDRRHANLISD